MYTNFENKKETQKVDQFLKKLTFLEKRHRINVKNSKFNKKRVKKMTIDQMNRREKEIDLKNRIVKIIDDPNQEQRNSLKELYPQRYDNELNPRISNKIQNYPSSKPTVNYNEFTAPSMRLESPIEQQKKSMRDSNIDHSRSKTRKSSSNSNDELDDLDHAFLNDSPEKKFDTASSSMDIDSLKSSIVNKSLSHDSLPIKGSDKYSLSNMNSDDESYNSDDESYNPDDESSDDSSDEKHSNDYLMDIDDISKLMEKHNLEDIEAEDDDYVDEHDDESTTIPRNMIDVYDANRNFRYYDVSQKRVPEADYIVPSYEYERLKNIDSFEPIDDGRDHHPSQYANDSEIESYSDTEPHSLYFSKLEDLGSISQKFKKHVYKNMNSDENHVRKESIRRKCYNQNISLAIHQKIQDHYNVKNISLLEDYKIFNNANDYREQMYNDFSKLSDNNVGLTLDDQYIESYISNLEKHNQQFIHINPFNIQKLTQKNSSVFLENQFDFIRINIFKKSLKLLSGNKNDRQLYSGELMGVPVIVKVQDFLDDLRFFQDTNADLENKRNRENYKMLMSISKYKNSKMVIKRQAIQKLMQYFQRKSEALNEAVNGICLSNMNHINHVFPFLYYSCVDLQLNHESQTAMFKIITIQEKMGITSVDSMIQFPKKYGFDPNFNNFNSNEKVKLKFDFYDSLIPQIYFGLLDAAEAMQLVHFDVRLPNITVEKTNQKYIELQRKGKSYKIPTRGYLFRLIDFGRSHVSYNGISTETHLNDLNKSNQNYSKLYFVDMMKLARLLIHSEDPHFIKAIIYISQQPKEFEYIKKTFTYRFLQHMLGCGLDSQRQSQSYQQVFSEKICDRKNERWLEKHPKTKNLSKPFRSFLSCILYPFKGENNKENMEKIQKIDKVRNYIDGLGYIKGNTYYSFYLAHRLEDHCNSNSLITNMLNETDLFDQFLTPQ